MGSQVSVDELVDRAARRNAGQVGSGFQDDKQLISDVEMRKLWGVGALDRGVNAPTDGGYLHVVQYSSYCFVGITNQPLPPRS